MKDKNRSSQAVELQRETLGSVGISGVSRLQYGLFSEDNFGYFLEAGGGRVIAVDVPDGEAILACLEREAWTLAAVLLTHTHRDHVVGLEQVLKRTGCELIAPAGASGVLADRRVLDGERFRVENVEVEAINSSGHSELDFSYWLPDVGVCFCGDTLFAWGCGRMFAGPAERFWNSIQKLRALPGDPWLACGHEYADDNLEFIRQHVSGLPRFAEFIAGAGEMQRMPVRLSEQREHNPFLRADDPEIAEALGMPSADPVEVFARLRELRNRL